MTKPLCFVLMPFGRKPNASGAIVDFDAVYGELVKPAIERAGLEPLRADEEQAGGIIHKAMFERLLICEFAVADLTTANANVFYELGVRHTARPFATVAIYAEGEAPKFDVNLLRLIPYKLGPDGAPAEAAKAIAAIENRIRTALKSTPKDSPIFQLLADWKPQSLPHEATDSFRDRADIAKKHKDALAAARAARNRDSVAAVEASLGDLEVADAGVVIDLFLSYRAVKAWKDMVRVADAMFRPVRETRMVQEQVALALNRDGRGDEAERVLLEVLKGGNSPETCGILGRIYKDRWEAADKAGDSAAARGHLRKALATYRAGFEADFRDAYPGVNAVTLAELSEPPDLSGAELLPVVIYALKRKMAAGKPDYWDHATLLELAVLKRDQSAAEAAADDAIAAIREKWEPETTARNLRLIREARERRSSADLWAKALEDALNQQAGS